MPHLKNKRETSHETKARRRENVAKASIKHENEAQMLAEALLIEQTLIRPDFAVEIINSFINHLFEDSSNIYL